MSNEYKEFIRKMMTATPLNTPNRPPKLNALKDGHAGHTVVVPEHESVAFVKHVKSFQEEYRPVGATEKYLVESLASLSWGTGQIRALIVTHITIAGYRTVEKSETATPEINAAYSQVRAAEMLVPKIDRLGIYENRKHRQFLNTMKELVQIQTRRKIQQKEELALAALYLKADRDHRDPSIPEWHPSDSGFVCSVAEIDRELLMQKRLEIWKIKAA